jgi:hypothetical protein
MPPAFLRRTASASGIKRSDNKYGSAEYTDIAASIPEAAVIFFAERTD